MNDILLEIFKTLIGTFAGALVAILTIWLGERAGRRRVINEWFENTFLFKSIEPLLHKARGIVTNIALEIKDMPETLDDDTRSQTVQIDQLLRDDTFGRLWAWASCHLKRNEFKVAQWLFQKLSISLRDLQDAALETTITNRRSVFTLADSPPYKKVLNELKETEKEYAKLIGVSH